MTTIEAPKTVHGMEIVRSSYTPSDRGTREGHVILVQRGQNAAHPYVTGWLGAGDSNWTGGHYFEDKTSAVADFNHRVRRGY